ncbi:dTDP-4-dehydrorhamnose reductase family protein [Burkholderia multivorans]|uniref:dTDP-4-dehydrorhamnose reductase family protein n=1 Tax=Burkholderia multivorans TaxID=87883 RepID=UPI0019D0C389|nr:SDR family oxidoreductase [Burkholderia multivorans]MBN6732726.1 SDR family oxidoreductase [Burkholderia multivorans]MBN6738320.1 SDR family oxidoreductase [Burkholderia multivorans]MBN7127634.1 SDR family oxidoreductase [Burkholderia multivorans]MBN8167032.1 SDR family oxidoreductase [Burkholderia multivorans]MBN8172825.1 SDR family oxidoreductase [Burkholderia multivorans]
MTVTSPSSRPATVLVIGASGLLGRAVVASLARDPAFATIATIRNRDTRGARLLALPPDKIAILDVLDRPALERAFDLYRPAAVVVCAAERRPDVCERDPAGARAINVDAPARIGALAARYGVWTLGISTDYVFDGRAAPYREDATPNPLNVYGRTKLEGEAALLAASPLSCVLRLPLLYGPIADWSESAVTSLVPAIVASARGGADAVGMDAWAIRYPTYTPDVAGVIRDLLHRHLAGASVLGIRHWSGDEAMTKYEIAQRIADALGLRASLAPIDTPADATPRPYDCHLDAAQLHALGIHHATPFDTALREVLRDAPPLPSLPSPSAAPHKS